MRLEGYKIKLQFTVPLSDGRWETVEPGTPFVILETEVLIQINENWEKTTLTPKFIEVNTHNFSKIV